MSESLRRRIAELSSQLELLPEAEEPPPTILHVIRQNQQEQDWQKLLFHHLSPDEAHGLDHALLEHFLSSLANRDDLEFEFSRFDLADLHVEQEVKLSNGRFPDAVIWVPEQWFICWELKIGASEGQDQTPDYVDAESFQSIDLPKESVPTGGHHYAYLAPEDTFSSDPTVSPPEAEEFVPISWEWVASELQTFLSESHGEHPTRTTAQLETFIGTINSELTMTEYQESQQEKVELFLDYYDEISNVQQAFSDKWEKFVQNWGNKLAEALNAAIIEDSTTPPEYTSVELTMDDGETRQWTFRQGHSDWSWMFPREWWTKLDEDEPIFDKESPMARVGFLHRLGRNQEEAIGDNELIFYLRNAPTANDKFFDGFQDRFNSDPELSELLPAKTSRPGRKENVLEASYDIKPGHHDDFFEAYIAALTRAMDDHVISNPDLVYKIDSIYRKTVKEDTSF